MSKKEEQVYQFLVEWYCSENDAKKLVNGSYEYSRGIEEVDTREYNKGEEYHEYINSQKENWIQDVELPGSGWWLVGGLI